MERDGTKGEEGERGVENGEEGELRIEVSLKVNAGYIFVLFVHNHGNGSAVVGCFVSQSLKPVATCSKPLPCCDPQQRHFTLIMMGAPYMV